MRTALQPVTLLLAAVVLLLLTGCGSNPAQQVELKTPNDFVASAVASGIAVTKAVNNAYVAKSITADQHRKVIEGLIEADKQVTRARALYAASRFDEAETTLQAATSALTALQALLNEYKASQHE